MRVLSPISTKQLYNRNDASCPSKRQHASQSSSSSSSSSHHPLPLALEEDHSEPASKKMMTFHHRQHEYLPLPQRRDHQHHQYEYLPLPRKPTSRHNPTSRPHKKSTASCLCYNKAPRHHKSCMLSHQRSILLKRHHHQQRQRRRVTFGQTSVVHIIHNHHLISRPYKEPSSADALWLTSSQIAQNKRKMVLFAYMLKTKRLKMNQSELEDKGMLWGLERHLFDDDSDDDDDDSEGGADSQGGDDESISSISPPRPSINGHERGENGTNNDTNASASSSSGGGKSSSNTISASASKASIRCSNSTSKRRQQVFTAVLQEQHRQSQIGIWDVEALAKVSMEKSQGARERARVIGVLQQQSI